MKYLYIIPLLIIVSCKNKIERESTKNQSVKDSVVIELPQSNIQNQDVKEDYFYNSNRIDFFDFNQLPLSKDADDISNNDTEKYNVSNALKKHILEKENYYKLINYSNVGKIGKTKLFTVFGNYDYYTNILLVTTDAKNDSLIDYKTIASIIGDADNTTEIHSKFLSFNSIEIITETKKMNKENKLELLESKNKTFIITDNGNIEKK